MEERLLAPCARCCGGRCRRRGRRRRGSLVDCVLVLVIVIGNVPAAPHIARHSDARRIRLLLTLLAVVATPVEKEEELQDEQLKQDVIADQLRNDKEECADERRTGKKCKVSKLAKRLQ